MLIKDPKSLKDPFSNNAEIVDCDLNPPHRSVLKGAHYKLHESLRCRR